MTARTWDNSVFVAIDMRERASAMLINLADYLFFYAAA
jgi:hypothetical protein